MLDEQAILDRRAAYTFCLADVAKKKRAAEVLGHDTKGLVLQQWKLIWAIHVLQSFPLTGEDCGGQWCPDEDAVRCAMRIADPGCVKCSCEGPIVNPIPIPPPCNVVYDLLVQAALDASSYIGPITARVLVISNTQGVSNLWADNVGNVVHGLVPSIVPLGSIVRSQADGSFWIMTPGGIGAYFPLMTATLNGSTAVQVFSSWPVVNAYLNRDIDVQLFESTGWRTVYAGPEGAQAAPQVYLATLPTAVRVTYTIGACKYGPYISFIDSSAHDVGDSHDDSHG